MLLLELFLPIKLIQIGSKLVRFWAAGLTVGIFSLLQQLGASDDDLPRTAK